MGYCGEKFSQMAQTIKKTKGWGILSQSKSLFILNFWNCAEDDLTATDQHWSPRWQWKDVMTEMWLCPSPGLMWRCEYTCIFWKVENDHFGSSEGPGIGKHPSGYILSCPVIIFTPRSLVRETASCTSVSRPLCFLSVAWSHSIAAICINNLCFEGPSSNHLKFQWTPFNSLGWFTTL